MLYKLTSVGVLNTATGMDIPADSRNVDYQAFLTWQAAGNTPDPIGTPPAAMPPIAAAMQLDVAYSALVKAMAVHFQLTVEQIVAMITAEVGT